MNSWETGRVTKRKLMEILKQFKILGVRIDSQQAAIEFVDEESPNEIKTIGGLQSITMTVRLLPKRPRIAGKGGRGRKRQ